MRFKCFLLTIQRLGEICKDYTETDKIVLTIFASLRKAFQFNEENFQRTIFAQRIEKVW